jgi:hypothetical protein
LILKNNVYIASSVTGAPRILKLNPSGDVLWYKVYDYAETVATSTAYIYPYNYHLAINSNDELFLGCKSTSDKGATIIKLTTDGAITWARHLYGSSATYSFKDLVATTSNVYISGHTNQAGNTNYDMTYDVLSASTGATVVTKYWRHPDGLTTLFEGSIFHESSSQRTYLMPTEGASGYASYTGGNFIGAFDSANNITQCLHYNASPQSSSFRSMCNAFSSQTAWVFGNTTASGGTQYATLFKTNMSGATVSGRYFIYSNANTSGNVFLCGTADSSYVYALAGTGNTTEFYVVCLK